MKLFIKILLLIASFAMLLLFRIDYSYAAFNPFVSWTAEPIYCDKEWECWLDAGVELVKTTVGSDLETTRSFSEYIQDIIVYAIGFVTLVAVIYIIYAGFRILISSWEEDVIKKSKSTILYVVIGILVMWLAWSIATFAIQIGQAGKTPTVAAP